MELSVWQKKTVLWDYNSNTPPPSVFWEVKTKAQDSEMTSVL